ncbi:efflux transporter periplasmic adaptor subunit, partial|nr:efflux transporter periplasmic adaptor subunit [Escherichia coli]
KRIVYLVGPDNVIQQKDVQLGPKVDGYRVIQSGLKGDELVVVNGTSRVRPGAKVTPDTIELPPSKT